MSSCGLWLQSRQWVAVIIDDDRTPRAPLSSPVTPGNTGQLLDYLATAGISTLIVSDQHAHPLAEGARGTLDIRLVPHALLNGIRQVTGLDRRAAHHTARLLARWSMAPALRLHLQAFRTPAPQHDQLLLF